MVDTASPTIPSSTRDDTGGQPRPERLRALGAEIRARRTGKHLTTVTLARACGVSPSLISQVERGLTAPSLEVLWTISRTLGVPVGAFFPTGDDTAGPPTPVPATTTGRGVEVVRAGDRKRLGVTPSLTYHLLSPDLQHRIELIMVELGPGEEGPSAPFTHGGEEQLVVIAGQVNVWLDGEEWLLGAGDAITFRGSVPHRVNNPGRSPATVVAAISPPSF